MKYGRTSTINRNEMDWSDAWSSWERGSNLSMVNYLIFLLINVLGLFIPDGST